MSDSAEAKRRQQQKQEWLLRVVLIIAAAGALQTRPRGDTSRGDVAATSRRCLAHVGRAPRRRRHPRYLNLRRSLDEHRAHEASIKNAPKT